MDFKDEFDFISEKAKQLTDTGIRKADEVIGISKLKLRCIKIDALIKAKYTELGRTMYGMVKNDSSDADRIAQAVMEIDHLYKKMAQCNARIELMKKIVPLLCYFCIKCVNFEKTVYKQENKVYNISVKTRDCAKLQISILICYPLNPFPIYEYPCVKFHRGILFAIICNNISAQF